MFKTGYFKADLADNAWNNHRKNKSLCKKILEWFDHYFPKNVDGLSNELWGKRPLNVSDFSICFYTFNSYDFLVKNIRTLNGLVQDRRSPMNKRSPWNIVCEIWKCLNFGMVAVKFCWKKYICTLVCEIWKCLNFGMVWVKFW